MQENESFEKYYERFDNQTLRFDTEVFRFREWVEGELRSIGLEFESLEKLHESMNMADCSSITKSIIQKTRNDDFLSIAIPFVKKYLVPLVDSEEIALQRFFNFRILLPNQPLSLIPFHNGQLQGHGLGERTVWMPLTETNETSSLYLMNVEESRSTVSEIRSNKSSYREFQKVLKEKARPVNINYGEATLFTQENIHGSLPNETGKTRISFDFRILIKGLPFGQKIPGGYFAPLKGFDV